MNSIKGTTGEMFIIICFGILLVLIIMTIWQKKEIKKEKAERNKKYYEEVINKPKISINAYDEEEIHENCTVQILKNTVTGEISVGWWENE